MKIKWLISKFKSCGIYISEEGVFFLEDGTILNREYYKGICYRATGSTRRYYWRKLNNDKELKSKALRVKANG